MKANTIAKWLVYYLEEIENFLGDPELILNDMMLHSINSSKSTKEAVVALCNHYLYTKETASRDEEINARN